ncbi:DUF305 domain-containing protein [Rhodoplanes sp. TEM]|uniref:DUF305 domain-containing protein n=1 Tax=Rhodoplanes tepidamans TaxID=200616 RepID=A0ABT5JJK5_RHOTP|nr:MULTISPECIES: DUF305 domain-containing protein [Rhodoplanes]MDC7789898.1 DUF305 domain-containing protein [Rhodoplanes tepidamans]MDC7985581.1 DUF305 domain-containing protein [Rhodoplanes sp. TEM]MDQ0358792.1 hypothetical protein [Rhodoplanes tepidamans]
MDRNTIVVAFTVAVLSATGAAAHDTHHAPHASASPADATSPVSDEEAAFLRENDVAMDKMMTDMAVRPSGDVDRDFVAMMVPHHQGAIDMAVAVLRYGRNEQLRRLAQEIIVTQQQEIAAMRLAIGDPLPAPAAAPTQTSAPTTR